MAVKGVYPRNLLWTWKEYDSTGRKIACYVQAPLKALTLGTWALLPWAYPCFKFAPKEPSDREIGLLNQNYHFHLSREPLNLERLTPGSPFLTASLNRQGVGREPGSGYGPV